MLVMTTCFCLVPDCSGSNQRCPSPRILTLTVTDKRLLGKMCCQHINSRLSFLNALQKSEPNLFSSSAYNAISAWNVPSTSIESKSYLVFQRHPASDFAGDSNTYKVNPCITNYDTKAKKISPNRSSIYLAPRDHYFMNVIRVKIGTESGPK